MNPALLRQEVQQFLEENYKEDPVRLVLAGSPFPDIDPGELAMQLAGKKKAQKKIPGWFNTRNILYPPKVNLEQTSSEITSKYKAGLVEGAKLVDLTGGMGIDSYYFSKQMDQVVHCELSPELSEIADHNFKVLKAENIRTVQGDGLDYLRGQQDMVDWIYIDPSRRSTSGGRVFRLTDCLPNVPEHLDLLFKKGKRILVKTSPLLDLKAGISELEYVNSIHVVAVENEVKELLWVLENKPAENVCVSTVNFRKKGTQRFNGILGDQFAVQFQNPLKYLYEPNAAVMKSGLFESLGHELKLARLHPNTHLYTSDMCIPFPGRRFEILEVFAFKRKALKKSLPIRKAHISVRNFPESVANLRKQLKIEDGGEEYLFFTTLAENQRVVLRARKL